MSINTYPCDVKNSRSKIVENGKLDEYKSQREQKGKLFLKSMYIYPHDVNNSN